MLALSLLVLSCGDPEPEDIGAATENLFIGGEFCEDTMNVIVGTAGDDVLIGTEGDDCILGYGGDDRIEGLGGVDSIYGGDGQDELFGGAGNDFLWGDSGDDTVHGGPGDDFLWGEAGDDVLHGDDGNDGLKGGTGDDTLYGDAGTDNFDGNDGADLIVGGQDWEWIEGGSGCDIIDGRGGTSWMFGEGGDDILMSGLNGELLSGGPGNDVLRVESNPWDPTDGGDGIDACSAHGAPINCENPEPLLCTADAQCNAGEHCVVIVGLCVPDAHCTGASVAAPLITTHPGDSWSIELTPTWFTVIASGEDVGYQWYRNGALIPGATGAMLLLEQPLKADEGDEFYVIASNAGGSAISDIAHMHLEWGVPVIDSQPVDQTAAVGAAATFGVVARASDLTYQWRRGGVDIAGATSASYTLASVVSGDAGASFDVVVTNPAGSVTSTAATLTVDSGGPVVTTQPIAVTIDEGSDATFSVVATSATSYQWRRDGVDVAGATAASFTLGAVTLADDGASFDVVITGPGGSTTSAAALLAVNQVAPVITAHPTSLTIAEGASASFAVTATGSGLSYQWRRDGADIGGANLVGYTLGAASLADDGATYAVVVTNAAGSVTSTPATLTVSQLAPVITAQPAAVSVTEGAAASFSVTATGTGLSYQWRRDGVDIAAATAASYDILATLRADDGASLTVLVTNGAGSVLSAGALLSVALAAPTITAQPASQTVGEGASATFSVTATASELNYQWRRDAVDIGGATGASYTLSGASPGDSGASFSVVVTNGAGSVTSAAATLTVTPDAPSIVTQPVSLTIDEGASAAFTVAASGSGLSYQWQRGGVAVGGATSTSHSVPAASLADDGAVFTVAVTNASGSVTSAAATLSVTQLAPVISAEPVAVSVPEGASATFTVSAAGSALTYQWQRDAVDIVGATTTSYTLPSASLPDDGAAFRCVVTNGAGSVTSATAALSVTLVAPSITTQPVTQTVLEGGDATFSVVAAGSTLSYQWRRDAVDIAGATAAAYTLTAATLGDDGAAFSVMVSNGAGSVTSVGAALTVQLGAPSITLGPESLTVLEGATASFSVVATGSALTYQWQREGVAIAGANAASYTLASASLADDAASFLCVVQNGAGTATSAAALLTVQLVAPSITGEPADVAISEGQSASFSVVAVGSLVSYQWQRDGVDIAGATAASHTLPAASAADDGAVFRVIVQNAAGSATSATASLSVGLLAPSLTTAPVAQTVTEGAAASFSVVASGTALSYQWQRDMVAIAGATGASYTSPATSLSDDGASFTVTVSNSGGSVTSVAVTLSVNLAAPSITSDPLALTVAEFADATFTVAAEGSLLSYQWRRDGVDVPGEVATSYTLAGARFVDSGASFAAVVTNGAGTVTSTSAVLTVTLGAPSIDVQPADQTVTDGAAATFGVTATGSDMSYQWRRDGVDIAGATAASYSVASVTLTDSGVSFDVVVTNGAGSVTSTSALLLVNELAPTITAHPAAQTVDEGASASFSVVASGSVLTYQWQRDGVDIAGATSASYTLGAASLPDSGVSFSVVVANGAGSLTSGAALLTVNQLAPTLSAQPADLSVVEGAAASFTVGATGSLLTYQWQRNGVDLAGANEAVLALGPADAADDGALYLCVVMNAAGSVTSAAATLNVSLLPPAITAAPVDVSVVEGADATFSVAATGTAIGYQWQRNGVDVAGATGTSYTLPAATLSDGGALFAAVVSNTAGSVTSAAATLTITLAPPTITTQPSATTVDEGSDASFAVVAAGSLLSYQWEREGVAIAGATASGYTLTGATLGDAGAVFRVVVSNGAGSVTSAAAALSVTQVAPSITTQPTGQTVEDGSAAMFAVVATGTGLSYQWERDGVAVFGATDESYSFAATLADDGVSYRVVVSNGAGTVTSAAALLTVAHRAPTISVQPVDATTTEGGGASFGVTADGSALSYQWQKAGTNMPGETSATLSLSNVPFSDDGATYQVVLTNAAGTLTSAAATLTVQLAVPSIVTQPVSVTVDEGVAAGFSVLANGSLLTYQWQKDGVDLPGATSASLTVASPSPTEEGGYQVVVANGAGSVSSATATLTVNVTPPSITTEPDDAAITEGGAASFSVAATGSSLTYQWQRDGAEISGATTASYTHTAALLADDGATFRVAVTNAGGTLLSRSALLSVAMGPPVITSQPSSQSVQEGTSATFTVIATGTDISYQWMKDGAPAAGGAGATLSIPAATSTDAGTYHVEVSNSAGTVPSVQVTLSVSLDPPVITAQPSDVTVAAGVDATFTVAASGSSLSYQWLRNGVAIGGATSASYSFGADYGDDGATFIAQASNSGGLVASTPAVLHVSDDTPPDLLVDGPSSLSTEETRRVLTGTATDSGVGLEGVTVITDREATVFGASVGEAGVFTVEVALHVGANELVVTARDRAGNESSSVVTVTQDLPLVPAITITDPLLGFRTTAEQLTVSGTVISQLAPEDIRLTLGELVTFPSGTGGEYSFVFDNVPLSPGTNVLTVNGYTVHGLVSAQTVVAREEEDTGEPGAPPVIAISGASSETYLTTDEIPVAGTVTATRCVDAVTVNGLPATVAGEGALVTFDASLSFSAAGSDVVVVTVAALDCDGLATTVSYTVRRDDAPPVIAVTGLPFAPIVHPVLATPHRVSGTVTDDNIGGFSLGGMSVGLMPTADPRVWSFDVDVALVRAADTRLTLSAWDLGGNRQSEEIILRLDAEIDLEIVSPSNGDELLAAGATGDVDVIVSAPGVAGSDVVTASIDGGGAVTLAVAGSRGSGTVPAIAADGTHVLLVEIRASDARLLASASVSFELTDESTIPLELLRQVPENNASGVEANQFITLFFNKPIDPARMQVEVRETLHGRTYEAPQDGADLRTMSVVQLSDVSREREAVPGHAMNLPGNTMVAFYPSRDYGYDAEVFIDVLYDGATVGHTRFHVRPLPTLVQGFVADHDLNPIAGIEVTIAALGRTATTNSDGNYDFGWGESAAQMIPDGSYRAVINPGMANPIYGTLERDIRVRAGEVNFAGTARIPFLDRNESFHPLASGMATVVLAQGDLTLDLSAATVTFPDGAASGSVHAQLMEWRRLGYAFRASAPADWGFALQPAGVQVSGSVGVSVRLPALAGSYDYLDSVPEYGLLLGVDPASLQLVPVGVARIDGATRTLSSEGAVAFERLDYVAYARIPEAHHDMLLAYVAGDKTLVQLVAELEALP